MSFRVMGLNPQPFRHLYGLSDDALAAAGARRYLVDASPRFPNRVEMRDLDPGETALLLNYTHQPAATPYHASHAIFVREGAEVRYDEVNEIPDVLRIRMLSMRAFDADDMMVAADLVQGEQAAEAVERFLAQREVKYLQVHNAKRGCYAARIERA